MPILIFGINFTSYLTEFNLLRLPISPPRYFKELIFD